MITVTALGANSATLTYNSAATLIDLIQEVEDYITTHGWSLWDISAGTNARAYRSLKQDGVKYNYIILDWNTSGYVIMRAYESWDADAHTGLNQAMNTKAFEYIHRSRTSYNASHTGSIATVSEVVMQQPLNIGFSGELHIYCQSKYLILLGEIAGQTGTSLGGSPTMFFEYARDNVEDTALLGIPSHGILHADNMIAGFNNPSITYSFLEGCTQGGYVFGFCRLLNNATGENAIMHSWFALPEMFWCSPKSYFQVVGGGDYRLRTQFSDPILSGENIWSNKKLASNIFVGYGGGSKFTNPYIPNGRLYGGKIISSDQGALNDIAQIAVDGDGFFSVGGTLTDHLIIPLRDWTGEFDYRLRLAIPA